MRYKDDYLWNKIILINPPYGCCMLYVPNYKLGTR